MRTTLDLDDELVKEAKRRAAESGQTMTQIFEHALRELLRPRHQGGRPFELEWLTVEGRVRPGVDVDDRDALYDAMESRR